jgi:16S rRNA (cytidine1402-2'-O)-methyltransferase
VRFGALHLVASPIGNLSDISSRTAEVLAQADMVVAEDTRRARKLLTHLGVVGKTVWRFDAHASEAQVQSTIERLSAGHSVALLTDAGTPSVSDPGAALVRRCHELGIKVVPVPGPSAVTCAIAASGLVEGPFLFAGFLPRSGSKRGKWLDRIAHSEEPVVLFEAANRTEKTLAELCQRQPQRLLCVARELTKKFEHVELRSLQGWVDDLPELRGELTLVLGPGQAPAAAVDSEGLDQLVRRELDSGASAKDIAEAHHRSLGLSKRELYQRVLRARNGSK